MASSPGVPGHSRPLYSRSKEHGLVIISGRRAATPLGARADSIQSRDGDRQREFSARPVGCYIGISRLLIAGNMRAFIFDMDGLLIDSEPLWREAEIAVFGSVGISLSDQQCRETTGLRTDEVVRYWYAKSPWDGPDCEQVMERLLDAAQRLIVEHGVLMAGARDALSAAHTQGARLAIASSSPMRLIEAVVEKFALGGYFSVLHSAEQESVGKPDPAVYRTTMSLLDAPAHECVAFEDSLSGVRAAKAAGAMVIAVPSPDDANHPGFALADLVLPSLSHFSLDLIPPA